VIQEDERSGLSAVNVISPLLVPAFYCGDDMVKKVAVGFVDSRHRRLHCPTTFMLSEAGARRQALVPEARLGWDIDWGYVLNTRDWPLQTLPNLNDLRTSIDQLLNTTSITELPEIQSFHFQIYTYTSRLNVCTINASIDFFQVHCLLESLENFLAAAL
jgi:hypothetical protein